jgi:hypothetical protein
MWVLSLTNPDRFHTDEARLGNFIVMFSFVLVTVEVSECFGRRGIWLIASDGPHRKRLFQQFICCCLHTHCRGHVFVEPFPSSDGLFWLQCFFFQVSLAPSLEGLKPLICREVKTMKLCQDSLFMYRLWLINAGTR